jgi:hypothetical protein
MSNPISLQKGIEMTTLYRNEQENILAEEFRGKNILARSETFDRKSVEELLAKTGCEKMRIYYGMDSELKVHAILVAVNDKNEDILPTAVNENVRDDAYYLWEDAKRCPPECPPDSPLNP